MEILSSPLSIIYGYRKADKKPRSFILNLNVYRNTHYRILNDVKVAYKIQQARAIKKLGRFNKIGIIYVIHPRTKRAYDIMNIACIHSKFALDAMVELGTIPDDNLHHVIGEFAMAGLVDPDNPRVDIEIYDLTNSEEACQYVGRVHSCCCSLLAE